MHFKPELIRCRSCASRRVVFRYSLPPLNEVPRLAVKTLVVRYTLIGSVFDGLFNRNIFVHD